MSKKIIFILIVIVLVTPLLPRFFTNVSSEKVHREHTSIVPTPESDAAYSFQKDELLNKAVLFFQIQQSHSSLLETSHNYYFKDSVLLKIPPVVHTKINLLEKHFVTITVKKIASIDNVDKKRIVCTYEATNSFRFHYKHCSLISFENEMDQVLVQNIFEGGKKRELALDNRDILSIELSRLPDKSPLIKDQILLEATFDLALQ